MDNQQLDSPFHAGEQKIQSMLGVRENMERFGRMVIRDHMPEQHRQFFSQLPFVLVGHADQNGNPWASILAGEPGFIHSPSNKDLVIGSAIIQGDPLLKTLTHDQQSNHATKLGLLGIELPTRRRNRLAGHVTGLSSQGVSIEVDQSFGNCPQYIQSREFRLLNKSEAKPILINELQSFDDHARSLIEKSDTFYIASAYDSGLNRASDGADVSHRGGMPGFVRVDDSQNLSIPDYMGNNHFNTFGNIEETGKAGLLFIDFESGDVLTLTGQAEVDWDSPEITFFEGAQRLLKFKLTSGFLIKNAIPARWSAPEFSPNSELTGTWLDAQKTKEIEAKRNQWLRYQVVNIIKESETISSFHLKPESGQLFNFKPGQFLIIRLTINGKQSVRTYTVSSAREDQYYRISVKQELSLSEEIPDGVVSNYLHQQLQIGQVIEAKAPGGNFFFEPKKEKPALLVAAGIGITPMIAIIRQSLIEAMKTRYLRPITLVAIARNESERAFYDEINQLIDSAQGQINVYWCLTQSENPLSKGREFQLLGRPSKALYESIISNKQTDAYLCGPGQFMQQTYDTLRSIGLSDYSIYAEAFGPSSLKRDGVQSNSQIAKNAMVTIETDNSGSSIEQQWNEADGSLLEFLEGHGVQPAYGCRSGQCGSCKATLIKGEVEHFMPTGIELNSDEVLLCCAKPSKSETHDLAKISIRI